MAISEKRNYIWLMLLLLVLGSNIAIYNTGLYELLRIHESPQVVVGTLLDLLIVTPILVLIYLRKFSWKIVVGVVAVGCILATIAIPEKMLSPYKIITNSGLFFEAAIIAFELLVIGIFITHLPKLRKIIRADERPVVFSYFSTVQKFTNNRIVQIFSSELLVGYYALKSWKKKPREGISLHKNSSYIALQLMIIHGIVLESVGIHWWLHSKAPVLSFILLLINVYGLIFILADMQAMRLTPIYATNQGLYITFGLMKRAYIEYAHIEEVILDCEQLELKKQKNRVEFICRDFEEVFPQVLLKMKTPQRVDFMYGFRKNFEYVAIKCDAPDELLQKIYAGINNRNDSK